MDLLFDTETAMSHPSPTHYHRVQIALHWVIFLLFAFNFVVSEGMGKALRLKLEGGIPEGLVPLLHPPVGVAVLVLTLIRIVARVRLGAPDLPENGKPLMDKAAHWAHLALYALLVLIPLSGMAAWGGGIKAAGDVHEILVKITMITVVLHAVAAVFHQFVLKDNLLSRMRPGG
ncbi:cytochrome b561 [Pelagimonas varians]|uniref:Cytochrome b562 n=2 Tax=Pelagimonas varians TaxID=696760 RepID=A0A238KAB3_9RHOB|nr:cytochrome b561 [Pelagimonas varians]SMX39821.1 Cytochrome b562 [Pelagimonas varians]